MAHLRDISHDEPSQSPLPRKAPNIRVLIADEDPRVRHALRALIESEPDVVVVGEAWSVDDVVDSCSHLRPSVVLLDPDHPTLAGDVAVVADDLEAMRATEALVSAMPELRPLDGGPLENAVALEAFCAVLLTVNLRYGGKATLRLMPAH